MSTEDGGSCAACAEHEAQIPARKVHVIDTGIGNSGTIEVPCPISLKEYRKLFGVKDEPYGPSDLSGLVDLQEKLNAERTAGALCNLLGVKNHGLTDLYARRTVEVMVREGGAAVVVCPNSKAAETAYDQWLNRLIGDSRFHLEGNQRSERKMIYRTSAGKEGSLQVTCPSEEPLRGASQDFSKRLISDEALDKAQLPEVAPIKDQETGMHHLSFDPQASLGVKRNNNGRVGVLYMDTGEKQEHWTLVLEPAEARWLRETLGKMGY